MVKTTNSCCRVLPSRSKPNRESITYQFCCPTSKSGRSVDNTSSLDLGSSATEAGVEKSAKRANRAIHSLHIDAPGALLW